MGVRILASIAAADPLYLADSIRRAEEAGVDAIHVDIEDGVFVPNITYGMKVVRAVTRSTCLPIYLHLMVSDPEAFMRDLLGVHVYSISVHFEAAAYPLRCLARIRETGAKAGLAINPRTDVGAIAYALSNCDSVLVMSNEPDTVGEEFLDSTLERVSRLSSLATAQGRQLEIIVDGGVDTMRIRPVTDAGATAVVCGRAVFGATDVVLAVKALRDAAAGVHASKVPCGRE